MFLTTVYDLSRDFNMMIDKNVVDCFEENQLSQEVLSEIINKYNLEQNDLRNDSDTYYDRDKEIECDNKTSIVNENSLKQSNKYYNIQMSFHSSSNMIPDEIQYTGRDLINSEKNPSSSKQKTDFLGCNQNSKEKLNKNKVLHNDKLVNGKNRKPNLSGKKDGNSTHQTNRIVRGNKKNSKFRTDKKNELFK